MEMADLQRSRLSARSPQLIRSNRSGVSDADGQKLWFLWAGHENDDDPAAGPSKVQPLISARRTESMVTAGLNSV